MEEKKCCTVINNQYYGCCGNGAGAESVYSTEETVCGKWIDGEPIYRKVISGKVAEKSGNDLVFADISDLKINSLISLYGNLTDNQGISQITLQTSYNRTNGSLAAINMYYGNETSKIFYDFLNNDGYYSNCTANVVIEYTKK